MNKYIVKISPQAYREIAGIYQYIAENLMVPEASLRIVTEIESAIDEWIVGKNAQRNRNILKSRLINGLTFEELSEEYDMSVRQIQNIVYKSQEKIFKHL